MDYFSDSASAQEIIKVGCLFTEWKIRHELLHLGIYNAQKLHSQKNITLALVTQATQMLFKQQQFFQVKYI